MKEGSFMKLSRIIVLLFILILVGCSESKVAQIKNDIELTYALNDNINSVKENITLPILVDGIEITWVSNSAFAVIADNQVQINRQDSDIKATLTASFKVGEETHTKTFEITIIQSAIDFGSLFGAIYVPTQTDSSFTLPTSINDHVIVWTSSNEATLSSTGVVTQGNVNQTVSLTATITALGSTRSHTYEVLITALESFDVEAFRAFLSVSSSTEVDLILPTIYDSYPITWNSSNTNVLSNTGLITRQLVDTTVSLTASVTVNSQVYEVTFTVVVIKEEIILPDYQAILNQITLPSQTVTNLTLPTLIEGVTIVWSSNHASITTAGIVTRQFLDVSVTLVATIVEAPSFTKSFNILVLKNVELPVSTATPIAEVRLKEQGASVKVHGVITSLMTNGNFTIQDSTGAIPVYLNNNTGLKVGTEYVIEGKMGIFQGLIQIINPVIIETKGEKTLPAGIDLTGYSFNFDDVMLYEANIITYRDLEVTAKTTPNNAIELYLKNAAGETTFVRLDTRVNAQPNPFTNIEVGAIVDLFNVTVGQYDSKAQLLFTSRSTIVTRPKNPEVISIYGAVNRNYVIGNPAPNYLEGITAKNGYGDEFTTLLGDRKSVV